MQAVNKSKSNSKQLDVSKFGQLMANHVPVEHRSGAARAKSQAQRRIVVMRMTLSEAVKAQVREREKTRSQLEMIGIEYLAGSNTTIQPMKL